MTIPNFFDQVQTDEAPEADNGLDHVLKYCDAFEPCYEPAPNAAKKGLFGEREAFVQALRAEVEALFDFIDQKNRKYGNSALEPVRIFSKADPGEQLRVRMDDKLSRIKSGQSDDEEDPYLDLIGYLVLERVRDRLGGR
jgi:hypothetical protein